MPGIAKEVKDEILDKIKSGEKVAEVASKYGVSDRTIYIWLQKGIEENISPTAYKRLKRENHELKAIIGALTVQLETLKKKR